MYRKRRIGLLGGSFNPAHEGHLAISVAMLRRLQLDEIWWLVSPQNPLKSTDEMGDFADRFASAQAMASHLKIRVTDIECHLGTTYTADTLRCLRQLHPKNQFVWLMGADNLAQIHRWKDWESIFQHHPVAIYDREPYTYAALHSQAAKRFAKSRKNRFINVLTPPCWTFLHGRRHMISASFLRKTLGDRAFMRHNERA